MDRRPEFEWWLTADREQKERSPVATSLLLLAFVLAWGAWMEALAPGRFSLAEAAVKAVLFAAVLGFFAGLRMLIRRMADAKRRPTRPPL